MKIFQQPVLDVYFNDTQIRKLVRSTQGYLSSSENMVYQIDVRTNDERGNSNIDLSNILVEQFGYKNGDIAYIRLRNCNG